MGFLRFLRWLFAGIGLVVVAFVAVVLLLAIVMSRGPSIPRSATLVLRPGGTLTEAPSTDVFEALFARDTTTVRGFVDSLRKARRDPRITTVLLMPRPFDSPYWGKLQEMRDAIVEFRRSGKTVVAYLEYGGDREYYLASAANRVVLMPTSTLEVAGVASYQIFLRGALDSLGIYPDYLHVGEYKSAPEQLTEKGMTAPHREMAESLNRDAYDQLVQGIADGRKKSVAEVRALIDQGPFLAAGALRAGLVDVLAYEDQLGDRVPELRASAGRRVESDTYARVTPASVGIRPRARVAVVYASGTIVSGKGSFDPINGAVVGSDTLIEQIHHASADRSIDAIVLRIDSPGGSSLAADAIWRALSVARAAKPSRPLIASMSDLGASGGYYIAAPADAIVAEPGTLTGSIGVYGGKVVIGEMLRKWGVNEQTVATGANADIYSPFTPFTEPQRVKVMAMMRDVYDGFVQRVATSRHSTPERIDALARGRVWTGAQARARGLVDALGGLDTAVAIAKQRAKIPASDDVELVSFVPRRSVYDLVTESMGGGTRALAWQAVARETDARAVTALAPVRLFRRGESLALMPFAFVR